LWGEVDGERILHRTYGKGRIISGMSVANALKLINQEPDIMFPNSDVGKSLNWVHRREENTDIYFFTNQKNVIDHGLSLEIIDRRQEALEVNEIEKDTFACDVSFRIAGKQPEMWDPVSGQRRDLQEFRVEG